MMGLSSVVAGFIFGFITCSWLWLWIEQRNAERENKEK